MRVNDYTGEQIERMDAGALSAMLDRLTPGDMRTMLVRLSGRAPQIFEYLLRSPGALGGVCVCGLQADDDNWCILPAGHAESHDAGEFTWDTDAELHTIAVK